MTDEYRLDVYNESGVMQGVMAGNAAGGVDNQAGFLSLTCARRVNSPGLLTFVLRGDHPILTSLADKWQFELWRKPEGYTWRREISGIFRAGQWSYGEKSTILLYCPGVLSLLGMRVINFPAETTDMTAFSNKPAETIMKRLVKYNITSLASMIAGRKRAGTNWPATQISVQADGAGGTSRDWYCFGENLLENLQKLAPIAGGDFDLVKTSPTAYEFRFYTGQLGTDRTATVKFAMGMGNMGVPQYSESRTDEQTVACVWGQGEGADREYVTRSGANYSATNDIEMFVNASDVEVGNTAGLNDRGDQKLREVEAVQSFNFGMLQVPATLYGVHYFLGDLCKVLNPMNGDEYTRKVEAVTQTLDLDGKQSIETEVSVP